ncbi:MAG TPA: hypothetical protein V6D47_08720 [Oscillatoriaceae cyanobacterium]
MQRGWIVAASAVASLAACAAGGLPGPVPTPEPSVTVSAQDLSGQWVFGSANEPSPGPVVACNPFKIWNLTQTGSQLKGSVNACLGPCAAFTEETTGANDAGQVALSGESADTPTGPRQPVTYQLHFDAATQHLIGTRNGQPFWAAPFVKQTSPTCGPAPV